LSAACFRISSPKIDHAQLIPPKDSLNHIRVDALDRQQGGGGVA
jgi:hypothetical protein